MKKVLVSGVTGQDGSYMVDYLLANTEHTVYGMVRRTANPNYRNIEHNLNHPRFKLVTGDLADGSSIESLVRELQPDYFINFAAQSFVGSSWQIPEQTFDIVAMGVLRCLEAIRKHAPHCRFYSSGCHDAETKVMTKEGLKKYTDVKIGDLVYSINPQTKALEFKMVKKVFEYDYEGELFEFKNGGLRITPNHNVIYKTFRGYIHTKKAEDFIKLSDVKYPINEPLVGKQLPDKITLSHLIPQRKKQGNKTYGKYITEIDSLDLMYLIGLYIGDGSCRTMQKKRFISSQNIGGNKQKDNATGRFISNSNLVKDIEAVYECPQAILDIPPEDECYSRVTSTLDRCGIKWTLHGQCDITFHQWGLNHYFDMCGHSAPTKQIPEWILELDAKYQKRVLDGIIDSDGDDSGRIYTSSKKLQLDLLRLHVNCGIMPTLYERASKSTILKNGRVIKGNYPQYSVRGLKENTGYQRGKFDKIPYSGKVWCLEVEDNHNFMVERNGKLTFSGNSSEEMGDVQYSPQDINHPIRPRSPYGAAKAAARHIVKVWRESYGLYAIHSILYNHESPRRGEEFVSRKITKGVARIAKAIKEGKPFEPVELGNLDAKRDWSDARDFVEGIWMMMNQVALPNGRPNSVDEYEHTQTWVKARGWLPKEYVLASGETHPVREFVEKAFALAGWANLTWIKGKSSEDEYLKGVIYADYQGARCSQTHTLVIVSPKFYRPADVELLLGDSAPARQELGWKPKVSFDDLVKEMVTSELRQVGL